MLKGAQINYVSRNQLHCTANLNFGLMCKKAKYCCALSTFLKISVQLIVFLVHVLLPSELAQKLKLLLDSYSEGIPWKGTSGDLPETVN